MNILIVARGCPDQDKSGPGLFEFDQAKAIRQLGHSVRVAAVDIRSIRKWRKWGIERKIVDGVPYAVANIPSLGAYMPWALRHQFNRFGLKLLMRELTDDGWRPDIIHAHFVWLGYVTVNMKRKFLCPVVVTEHSSQIMRKEMNRSIFRMAETISQSADQLIVVSPILHDIYKRHFAIQSRVVPNILDIDLFKYQIKTDHLYYQFISVGNLVPVKRMNLIIDAFCQEFSGQEQMRLMIIGSGPEHQRLQNMINKAQMTGQITLCGKKTRSDIAIALRESDCFFLASAWGTFGLAFGEALATGTPVIATRCGGPESFIHEGNGIFSEDGGIPAIRKAMRWMVDNRMGFDRSTIAAETHSRFAPESIAKQLINIYQDVLAKQRVKTVG